jgi:hypothetical protein
LFGKNDTNDEPRDGNERKRFDANFVRLGNDGAEMKGRDKYFFKKT